MVCRVIAGVDGCHGGWVVALADGWPCRLPPSLLICPTFEALLIATAKCQIVVVDMPIGLPTGAEHRRCDEIGRTLLGPVAAARLFYAPPRPTLAARTATEFQSLHRDVTGKGAGLPVWGIVPKLRDVDTVMTSTLHDRVHEFHPELAWQHLAGAPLSSKHKLNGVQQRMALLRERVPDLDQITAPRAGLRRKDAKPDDLLDALVGLGVAQAIADGPNYARRIPIVEAELDQRRLRMEIWF
jgi:predicted RNase H-like nuclease